MPETEDTAWYHSVVLPPVKAKKRYGFLKQPLQLIKKFERGFIIVIMILKSGDIVKSRDKFILLLTRLVNAIKIF